MSTEAEKFRLAAQAARRMAVKHADAGSKSSWLKRAIEWERMAENLAQPSTTGDTKCA